MGLCLTLLLQLSLAQDGLLERAGELAKKLQDVAFSLLTEDSFFVWFAGSLDIGAR